jgi:hypothetical protein
MTKAELQFSRSLMAATNAIIAGLDNGKIRDAVNSGDLRCTAVEKVETFAGNETTTPEWRVLIEEASPDAYTFGTLVAEELARHGLPKVAVVTEW